METNEIIDRMKRLNHDMVSNMKKGIPPENVFGGEPEASEAPVENAQPVDYYQEGYNKRFETAKRKIPKGSRPKVLADFKAIAGDLAHAYRKAKDDSDTLSANGDKNRAAMIKQQYMEEKFLPAIEALVSFNSVDEVLNNADVLADLDDYALIDGGSASGYSASYIRQLYGDERGSFSGTSDAYVQDGVRQIKQLAGRNQLRAALGIAERLKGRIDNGNNIANEEDYDLIQRIILRVS